MPFLFVQITSDTEGQAIRAEMEPVCFHSKGLGGKACKYEGGQSFPEAQGWKAESS